MKQWIDKLRQERTLSPEELRQLLTGCDAETLRYINKQAQEVALRHFGNKIYIRGLKSVTAAGTTVITVVSEKEIQISNVTD